MTKVTKGLPSFTDPPLIEVVLSVQFEQLKNLQAAQIGLLWANHYRDKYPITEQHPPIAQAFEQFGEQRLEAIKIEVAQTTPNPRCWFINTEGTELIQIQNDRILHNWRKTSLGDDYPRYELIREKYRHDLEEFIKFVDDEKIGNLVINQCEVTYINHISSAEQINTHIDTANIFSNWESNYSDDFLWEPESVRFSTQHIIKDQSDEPLGRLHINIQPAFLSVDKKPIYVMTLISRGKPLSNDISGIFNFLDYGREIIVRAFKSTTTPRMHNIWNIEDDFNE
ncbi:MAG TPA: TIGR04255 family protein [candidate division Zixibacteria bacterium]|nr:TIGR04255 family protein [candidate division Zixibacteria bacterium]